MRVDLTFGGLTTVLFVIVRWRPRNVVLVAMFVLEAVVDDEGWLVDIQVGSCRLGRSRLGNSIFDQGMIALGLNQANVRL